MLKPVGVILSICCPCAALAAQSVPTVVQQALAAQLGGMGGCAEAPHVRAVRSQFFPGVQFYDGTCLREHGDPALARVALDDDSVLYVLDSWSAFRLLLHRHPPQRLESASAVEYAAEALLMTGVIRAPYQLVLPGTRLADSLRASAVRPAAAFASAVYSVKRSGWRVDIVATREVYGGSTLERWEPIILPQTGDICCVGGAADGR